MQVPVNLIASPLNYTGGKYKLLPQLLPLFPNEVNTFVDLFCGGCNVAVNAKAKKYICNDGEQHLIGLLKKIKSDGAENFSQKIESVITQFNLSNSSKQKYEFYDCNSSAGLGKYNRPHFLELREHFNSISDSDEVYYYEFFTLVIYAFNNQIRFNSECKYNLPVGKRDFNVKMRNKLTQFAKEIQNKKIKFTNHSFEKLDLEKLEEDSFIYADPPYLITTATYNEKNGWTENEEKKLLSFLDECNVKNIKFALSNVLKTDGKKNQILEDWLLKNDYNCNHLKYSYKNSNYHKKENAEKTDEVLITNYEVQNG